MDWEARKLAASGLSEGLVTLSIEAIRTELRDETVGRSTCAAFLKVQMQAGSEAAMAAGLLMLGLAAHRGWNLEGAEAATLPIQYAAQLTDDRQQVVVSLADAEAVGGGAGVMAMSAALAKARQKEGAGTPDKPAAVAQADDCTDEELETTAGLLECHGRQFEAADQRLNAAYKAAMSSLAPDRAASLRSSQRAWLADRDSGCEAEVTADGTGGTAAALNIAGCILKRTTDRTALISSFK